MANATGKVELWQYLDSNCRDTHALVVNLTFTTAAGAPLNGTKVYGYGMTGNRCQRVLSSIAVLCIESLAVVLNPGFALASARM